MSLLCRQRTCPCRLCRGHSRPRFGRHAQRDTDYRSRQSSGSFRTSEKASMTIARGQAAGTSVRSRTSTSPKRPEPPRHRASQLSKASTVWSGGGEPCSKRLMPTPALLPPGKASHADRQGGLGLCSGRPLKLEMARQAEARGGELRAAASRNEAPRS